MSTPPPGWYQDPLHMATLRWWDGAVWTDHTAVYGPRRPTPAELVAEEREWEGRTRIALYVGAPITAAIVVGGALMLRAIVGAGAHDNGFGLNFSGGGIVLFNGLGVGGLVAWIFLMLWTQKATEVARAIGLRTRHDPSRAAVAFIVPVAGLWWVPQAITDLLPAGDRHRRLVPWWWTVWIASGLAQLGVLVVIFASRGAAVVATVVGAVLPVVTAVLTLRILRAVGRAHRS
jgi:hypothetical protein